MTALMNAVCHSNPDIAGMLIQKGACVDTLCSVPDLAEC